MHFDLLTQGSVPTVAMDFYGKAESHGRSDVYVQIVHKVTQELAILGLISFGLFMYLQLEIDIEDHYLLTFGWYHTHSFVEL